jgi:hypothetical protein
MAENGKSGWFDPRFLLALFVVVAGGVTTFAVTQTKVTALERQVGELEKKTEVLGAIDAKLDGLDKDMDNLTKRVEFLIQRELGSNGH